MVRRTSQRVCGSPGCAPLFAMYNAIVPRCVSRWQQSDLDKRIKEASLKTIDLKAEWARTEGKGGGPTSDLKTWLRRSKPLSFLFMAIRVVDEIDLKRTIFFAIAANQVMDEVGLIAYGPVPSAPGYRPLELPTHLELDRVLTRACTALRVLP